MQKDDPFGQPIVYTVVLQASAQKSSLIWPLPVHAYGIRFAIWLASSFYGATASSWTGAIERLHRSVRGAERLFYLLRLPRGGAIMLPMLPTWRLSVWLFVLGGTVLLAQRPATRLRCTGASDMNGWGYKYQPASKEMPERCSGEVSASAGDSALLEIYSAYVVLEPQDDPFRQLWISPPRGLPPELNPHFQFDV